MTVTDPDGDSPPARIQPSGFLLALSSDWIVERASANLEAFLGHDPAAVVGEPVAAILSDNAIHALRNRLALLRGPDAIERLFACKLTSEAERAFDIALHVVDDRVIVEAEPSSGKSYGDVTGTLRGMVARLDQGDNGLLDEGVRQLRSLTGFDRVMVIRFAADGSGEVVAECARGGIAPLLGHRSKSAVLPGPALRVVADVDAVPVTLLPAGAPALDLSRSLLCAASNADLVELRGLGARAAMTIGLSVAGAPWGVISCHHHLPRSPSFERRSMAELFAAMFAMKIEIAELRQSAGDRG